MMKMQLGNIGSSLRNSLLISLLILMATSAFAQSDPLLQHFSIAKSEGKVLLNWVTRPGSTCDGIDILRSTDSINYVVIHHIGGVCGGPNTAIPYDFVDEHPVVNRRNYYRLDLGNVGSTSVRAIDVVALGAQGLQVRPNPVVDRSTLYFENATHQPCQLLLINASGVIVAQWETREEFISLQSADFAPGIYFIRILDADGKFQTQGKVIVLR